MALSYQGKVAPTASRYLYSTACKFVAVNSDGQRNTFGGAVSLSVSQSNSTQARYELNDDKLHPYEITKGLADAVKINIDGVEIVTGTALQQITGVPNIKALQNSCIPFEIEFYEIKQALNQDGTINPSVDSQTQTLQCTAIGCIIKDYSKTYKTGTDIVVNYRMSIEATRIKE